MMTRKSFSFPLMQKLFTSPEIQKHILRNIRFDLFYLFSTIHRFNVFDLSSLNVLSIQLELFVSILVFSAKLVSETVIVVLD